MVTTDSGLIYKKLQIQVTKLLRSARHQKIVFGCVSITIKLKLKKNKKSIKYNWTEWKINPGESRFSQARSDERNLMSECVYACLFIIRFGLSMFKPFNKLLHLIHKYSPTFRDMTIFIPLENHFFRLRTRDSRSRAQSDR